MAKIGYLTVYNNGSYKELHGEIKTLEFQISVRLVPDVMRTNENAPDYIAYADSAGGDGIEIGAAWKKRKAQQDGSMLEFLSLTIDDMSLPQPLNVAAFKKDDGGYDISLRRRKSRKNEAA